MIKENEHRVRFFRILIHQSLLVLYIAIEPAAVQSIPIALQLRQLYLLLSQIGW